MAWSVLSLSVADSLNSWLTFSRVWDVGCSGCIISCIRADSKSAIIDSMLLLNCLQSSETASHLLAASSIPSATSSAALRLYFSITSLRILLLLVCSSISRSIESRSSCLLFFGLNRAGQPHLFCFF